MAGRIFESPDVEDDLGDLMVMTDEEDDGDDEAEPVSTRLIPETPAR
jgi:hypothetical protein